MKLTELHHHFDLGVATSRFAAIPDQDEYTLVSTISHKLSLKIAPFSECSTNKKIDDKYWYPSLYSKEYKLYRLGVLSFALFLLGDKHEDAVSEIKDILKHLCFPDDIAENYYNSLNENKNSGFQTFISDMHNCIENAIDVKVAKFDTEKLEKIETKIEGLSEQINFALSYISSDPHGSLAKTRMVCEKILLDTYRLLMKKEPKKPLLGDMLNDNQFTRLVERRILSRFNSVRDMANLGVHGEKVNIEDAKRATDDLIVLIDWYIDIRQN